MDPLSVATYLFGSDSLGFMYESEVDKNDNKFINIIYASEATQKLGEHYRKTSHFA